MALLKVICWAIIFIKRIRFPPGKSLATILTMFKYIVISFENVHALVPSPISLVFLRAFAFHQVPPNYCHFGFLSFLNRLTYFFPMRGGDSKSSVYNKELGQPPTSLVSDRCLKFTFHF